MSLPPGPSYPRALQTLGLDDSTQAPWLVRDAAGRATGVIDEGGIRGLAARLPTASGEALERSTRLMIRDLNRAGLTAFGSAGCEADVLPLYRRLAEQQQLDVRVFCITGATAGSPAEVDRLLPQIPAMTVRHGDAFIDHIAFQVLEAWRRDITSLAARALSSLAPAIPPSPAGTARHRAPRRDLRESPTR